MTVPHIHSLEWIKSSYSEGNGGECVEFTRDLVVGGIVPVRDSKNPTGPALAFTPAAWAAFTRAFR
ncbi:DUF397 domain-containing protein [Streptomyces sp. UNOB3_S3]|uniref:DUF397 domain-containing protein n=1 Tax=Streptomyces sp. UNOB3_S3 TaxID=2871682 RepID=UPI001E3E2EDC|nr:DUF397 domain-containing protein [Streptomyces sp. UNOB3_S3]MCC3777638.1 DUF397 domain-containing protein [Streptomyces sp. UNOB3_S3]